MTFDVWNAKDEIIEIEDEIVSIIEQLTMEKNAKENGGQCRGEEWRKGAQYAVRQKKKQSARLKVAIKRHNTANAQELKERSDQTKADRVARANPQAKRDELFTQALKAVIISHLGKDVAAGIFIDCGVQADRKLKENANE